MLPEPSLPRATEQLAIVPAVYCFPGQLLLQAVKAGNFTLFRLLHFCSQNFPGVSTECSTDESGEQIAPLHITCTIYRINRVTGRTQIWFPISYNARHWKVPQFLKKNLLQYSFRSKAAAGGCQPQYVHRSPHQPRVLPHSCSWIPGSVKHCEAWTAMECQNSYLLSPHTRDKVQVMTLVQATLQLNKQMYSKLSKTFQIIVDLCQVSSKYNKWSCWLLSSAVIKTQLN